MNPVQKLLQPLINMARETKELEWAEIILLRASGTLAALTLVDFVTLAAVPTVEWEYHAADDEYVERYLHNGWLVCPSADANGIISSYAAKLEHGSPHYWRTESQAKRYVEICIHLETIKRQLLAELAGDQ